MKFWGCLKSSHSVFIEPFGSKKQEMLWKDQDILVEKTATYKAGLYSMKQRALFKETHEYKPEITEI